jgi:hypothetical protein
VLLLTAHRSLLVAHKIASLGLHWLEALKDFPCGEWILIISREVALASSKSKYDKYGTM